MPIVRNNSLTGTVSCTGISVLFFIVALLFFPSRQNIALLCIFAALGALVMAIIIIPSWKKILSGVGYFGAQRELAFLSTNHTRRKSLGATRWITIGPLMLCCISARYYGIPEVIIFACLFSFISGLLLSISATVTVALLITWHRWKDGD